MSDRSTAGGNLLESERLLLRSWRVEEAAIHRELWIERDPRVPAHRRIDADGRPSVADLEDRIRRTDATAGLGLPALERKTEGDVIGYCGLVEGGPGAYALDPDHPGPRSPSSCCVGRRGRGTRPRPPALSSSGHGRPGSSACTRPSGPGTRPRSACWESWVSSPRARSPPRVGTATCWSPRRCSETSPRRGADPARGQRTMRSSRIPPRCSSTWVAPSAAKPSFS